MSDPAARGKRSLLKILGLIVLGWVMCVGTVIWAWFSDGMLVH
jgi:hypothetical protein